MKKMNVKSQSRFPPANSRAVPVMSGPFAHTLHVTVTPRLLGLNRTVTMPFVGLTRFQCGNVSHPQSQISMDAKVCSLSVVPLQ